jgi:hypothetical protein
MLPDQLANFTNTKASSINQPRATHRIAVLSSHACAFVCSLQTFTNTKASSINQPSRARNPRFYFVHARIAGTKPHFLTKKDASKIGDSVLCNREQRIASQCFHLMRVLLYAACKLLQIQKPRQSTNREQPDPEIPESRFIVFASNRRLWPV